MKMMINLKKKNHQIVKNILPFNEKIIYWIKKII